MTKGALRKAVERGQIPCQRIGNRLRFRRADLLRPPNDLQVVWRFVEGFAGCDRRISSSMCDGSEICWSRTYEGRNPSRVRFTGSAIACSYIGDQGHPGTPGKHTLISLYPDGTERWKVADFQLEVVLPDERLVGATHGGKLRVLDGRGRKSDGILDGRKKVECRNVESVDEHGKGVMVRGKHDFVLADSSLQIVDRLPVPPSGVGTVVGDGVIYIEGERVMRIDRRGRSELFCPIPIAMAHEAMDRWERETGFAALAGTAYAKIDPAADPTEDIVAAVTTPAKQTAFGIGDRLALYAWGLSYLDATKTIFLYNATHPHLLVCVGVDGVAKWCTYLSSGCCGGGPVLLSSGELVMSSGCGGILSWLNPDTGAVLRRSVRHDGIGMATAYVSHVRAFDDGSCAIDGGIGVVSYGANGALRWRWPKDPSCFDYDQRLGLLATATWFPGSRKTVSIECVKNLGGRSAIA
jgi:hypothetical protein